MSGILAALAGIKTAIATAVDEYFNRVTLLLPGNGTNGAQNNTFLDSSSNTFSITRNGNTTQGTFSPFSQTGWSTFFGLNATSTSSSISGTTLTVGGTVTGVFAVGTRIVGTGISAGTYITALGTGTGGAGTYTINTSHSLTARQIDGYSGSLRGDITTLASSSTSTFTIDFWYYPTSFTTEAAIIGDTDPLATLDYITARVNTSGKLVLYWYDGGSKTCTGSTTLTLNAWNYCAVKVSSNAISLYVNSSTADTLTGTTTLTNRSGTTNYGIGKTTVSTFAEGYLSNIRVSTIARTISVPTAPFTSDADTRILVLTDNRFVAYGSVASTLTPSGLPSVQAFSPFAPTAAYSTSTVGGSGYFDGSGDYLTTPTSSGFSFAGNFTIECWFYPTAALSTATSLWIMAIGASDNFGLNVGATSTIVYLGAAGGSFTATGNVIQSAWNHLAVVRNGSTVTLYINGVAASGTGTTSATLGSSASIFRLGGFTGGITGYVSGWRIVNGSAVYTTPFTPPTAPPTAITNTQLLLNFTNAGITDATAKNDLETVGNAQISTTQSKFGGSSMSFDGTNSVAKGVTRNINQFGTGDFTVEMWLYPTTFVNYKSIWCCNTSAGSSTGFHLGLNSSGQIFIYSASNFQVTSNNSMTLNTWNHIAVQRNGSTIRLFINGTVSANTWTLTTQSFTDGACLFGASPAGTSEYYAGYIDDARITRGFARYSTSGFTPPTAAFALQ